ncbi:hypothetical protein [Halomonas caseinilytica]|nr:hypothetical protein [Halomonas caseinilytica]
MSKDKSGEQKPRPSDPPGKIHRNDHNPIYQAPPPPPDKKPKE